MNFKQGLALGIAVGATAAGLSVLRSRRDGAAPAGAGDASEEPGDAWTARRRVVILGSGFGGMAAAEALTDGNHEGLAITMVDRRNYHLFTPFLYHVPAGLVGPRHIAYPARALTSRRGIRFRESTVQSIDLEGRRVVTDEGDIPYDDLVIALGATTNYFGLEAAEEHSFPLKTMGDAVAIHNRIIDAFEAADVEDDPERRRELLTFVIVGGGATGVEMAGGLHGLVHYVLVRHYPNLNPKEITIVVVEAMGHLLPGWDPFLIEAARRALERRGILVRLNSPVVGMTPGAVELKGGEWIRAYTVVWTAGVRPTSVVADLPVPKVKGGRLPVNEYLELPDYPGVFAIGDVAGFIDPATGQVVPGLAATAEQQGHAVGKNLQRRAQGLPMEPYRYKLVGLSVSLGRNEAAAVAGPLKVGGFVGWIGWRLVHLLMLRGWRNRLGVLFDWFFSYLFQRQTLRLEAGADKGLTESRVSPAAAPGRTPV